MRLGSERTWAGVSRGTVRLVPSQLSGCLILGWFSCVHEALDGDGGTLSGEARAAVVAHLVRAWSWLDPAKAQELAAGLPLAAADEDEDGDDVDAQVLERTAEVTLWRHARARASPCRLASPFTLPFFV